MLQSCEKRPRRAGQTRLMNSLGRRAASNVSSADAAVELFHTCSPAASLLRCVTLMPAASPGDQVTNRTADSGQWQD